MNDALWGKNFNNEIVKWKEKNNTLYIVLLERNMNVNTFDKMLGISGENLK